MLRGMYLCFVLILQYYKVTDTHLVPFVSLLKKKNTQKQFDNVLLEIVKVRFDEVIIYISIFRKKQQMIYIVNRQMKTYLH